MHTGHHHHSNAKRVHQHANRHGHIGGSGRVARRDEVGSDPVGNEDEHDYKTRHTPAITCSHTRADRAVLFKGQIGNDVALQQPNQSVRAMKRPLGDEGSVGECRTQDMYSKSCRE